VPVGEPLEAVVRGRRARDVTAQPLELSPIAAVNELPSVHVDAADLGDGLISERAGVSAARWRLGRQDESERAQARSVAAHGDPLRGCGVAGGEPGLIERQLRRRGIVLFTGNQFGCALGQYGSVLCLGHNNNGELGGYKGDPGAPVFVLP